ncbi:DUF1345 domain-containing protein [Cryobacterium melibiosiphilum]|uniref:DUF1345 domain-containing protein n=1 Tax=Cryobacterium melibiosiphilum TaxID=995039 RepID=UPI001F31D2BD|nr:DUF1345 domain-containing protein [Cryobacterium melibiosiphilum]
MKTSAQLPRVHRSSIRLIVMLVVGLLAATVSGLIGGWNYPIIVGWAAACLTYVVWVWLVVGHLDAAATATHATREDPARRVTEVLILLASIASLGTIVFLLTADTVTAGSERALVAGLAVLSVALSWTLIHTLFTLRYASLYYSAPIGGVDFNQEDRPRYTDFAYLSFTLGMTYQVSDTNLTNHAMRMTALRHALLSFPFGSGILATVVNLVAGLSF